MLAFISALAQRASLHSRHFLSTLAIVLSAVTLTGAFASRDCAIRLQVATSRCSIELC
jgi:hypothetical protein